MDFFQVLHKKTMSNEIKANWNVNFQKHTNCSLILLTDFFVMENLVKIYYVRFIPLEDKVNVGKAKLLSPYDT